MENSFAKGYRASAEGREGMLPNETFTLMLNVENLDNYYCDSLYNLKNDNYLPAKIQLIDIPNYSLSFNLSGAEWLFMGLITLLIANILKRSVEYKEEQDLTI